jgi:hypothetical protein
MRAFGHTHSHAPELASRHHGAAPQRVIEPGSSPASAAMIRQARGRHKNARSLRRQKDAPLRRAAA